MECMAEPAAADSLLQAVRQALKSDDTTLMRVALQRTETHLAKMKDKMAKCKAKMGKEAAAGAPATADAMCCKKKAEPAPVDSSAGAAGTAAPAAHVH
jgi:hypothetical protein